jgi:hypothetical protein
MPKISNKKWNAMSHEDKWQFVKKYIDKENMSVNVFKENKVKKGIKEGLNYEQLMSLIKIYVHSFLMDQMIEGFKNGMGYGEMYRFISIVRDFDSSNLFYGGNREDNERSISAVRKAMEMKITNDYYHLKNILNSVYFQKIIDILYKDEELLKLSKNQLYFEKKDNALMNFKMFLLTFTNLDISQEIIEKITNNEEYGQQLLKKIEEIKKEN